MTPELPLIKDALNRVLRTLMQQVAVLIQEALIYLAAQPNLSDIEPWQVAVGIVIHGVLSMATAFIHRVAVDPSKLPSAAPPATPTFRPAPLAPPFPSG